MKKKLKWWRHNNGMCHNRWPHGLFTHVGIPLWHFGWFFENMPEPVVVFILISHACAVCQNRHLEKFRLIFSKKGIPLRHLEKFWWFLLFSKKRARIGTFTTTNLPYFRPYRVLPSKFVAFVIYILQVIIAHYTSQSNLHRPLACLDKAWKIIPAHLWKRLWKTCLRRLRSPSRIHE